MIDNSWLTSIDGLPPAGTECEVLNPGIDNAEWERCTILFMGKGVCVYESESCVERVGHHDLYNVQFRPIKTERELAVDLVVDIYHNNEDIGQIDEVIELAKALFDAGLLRSKNES